MLPTDQRPPNGASSFAIAAAIISNDQLVSQVDETIERVNCMSIWRNS